jgi:hypothetical protein
MSVLSVASFVFAVIVLAEALTFAAVVLKLVLPKRES